MADRSRADVVDVDVDGVDRWFGAGDLDLHVHHLVTLARCDDHAREVRTGR